MNDFNVYELDSSYHPFPSFAAWLSRTNLVTARWDKYVASLKEQERRSPHVLQRARNIATRAAAIDTGAIEGLYEVDRGFTFTVALETAAWETALAQRGEQVRPMFEAQLSAYQLVLDLATKAEPISEAAIRALHEEVCRAQQSYPVQTAAGPQNQPLPKGKYKANANHVWTRTGQFHSYAPVDVTPDEVFRLIAEMRTEAFLNAHPVMQAAYAHYGLVVIHPFADGNGRVARALASTFMYRAISAPIVILSEQKNAYFDSLADADGKNYQSFVDFILARSIETVQMLNESLHPEHIPDLETSVMNFGKLYEARSGYSQDQVDKAGFKLQNLLVKEFENLFLTRRSKQLKLTVSKLSGGGPPALPQQYRFPTSGPQVWILNMMASPPAAAGISEQFYLVVPIDAAGPDDLKVTFPNRNRAFQAHLDDLMPNISTIVRVRAQFFADRVFAELLNELTRKADEALRGRA